MSLTTPDRIRDLQIKLYRKAKNEPGFRFYQLYDKVYREDILLHAYLLAKANDGAPGVDGESFRDIESRGREEWLNGLRKELHEKTYKPQPVRRKMIEKPGGGERPLGIPTIRDRVAQTAAKLVLEPIWEADLEPNAYGYRGPSHRSGRMPARLLCTRGPSHRSGRMPARLLCTRPRKSAQDAIRKVDEHLHRGYTNIVDADLSKYFDTIPHSELLQCVARRIVDGPMLHLIKMWIKAPVDERDENGKGRVTGGKDNDRGTPQGGVVSPALANLYMNRMLKGWRQTRRGEQYQAYIVNYADDFVILSRGKAKEALEWTRGVLGRLDLTLNEKKTSIRNARQERFDFLGYTFGPHINPRDGGEYIGYSPSNKSVGRIKQKVGELLERRNGAPWEEVRQKLNRKLQGWRQYFNCGSTGRAYKAVDEYVYDRVRNFLRRRHKVSSQGTRQFSSERVYGSLGVFRLQGPRAARA